MTLVCMDYKKITILPKKKKKKKKKDENVEPFQNGGQITNFYFASFRFKPKFEKKKHFPKGIFQWNLAQSRRFKPKFEKNTFPKEFFNKIWLKVGEHKYIYITEITFKKNYSILKWRPKQFFDIAQQC